MTTEEINQMVISHITADRCTSFDLKDCIGTNSNFMRFIRTLDNAGE